MSLLDTFMPSPDLREVDHVAVNASPEASWSAVRAVDLYRIRLVRDLFTVRLVPDRVRARLRGVPSPVVPTSTIDDIVRGDSQFRVLREELGREIVVGAAAKVWWPRIELTAIDPDAFAPFASPGFAKIAWGVAVAPRPGGAWITIDLRVAATDPEARARFRRYWSVVGRFSRAIRKAVGARIAEDLGRAMPDDRTALAGDEILPGARFQATHHVDIEAPPADVWPWLVQMGRRRAGWYGWDLFDNGGVASADRIIPALQKLEVGDVLPTKAKGPDGFTVLLLDPPRALVLGDPSLLPGRPTPTPGTPRATWAFSLEPIGDAATHLVVRVRTDDAPGFKSTLFRPVAAGLHELMEWKQLRTLKHRAEAHRATA